jgi:hypothetical protein
VPESAIGFYECIDGGDIEIKNEAANTVLRNKFVTLGSQKGRNLLFKPIVSYPSAPRSNLLSRQDRMALTGNRITKLLAVGFSYFFTGGGRMGVPKHTIAFTRMCFGQSHSMSFQNFSYECIRHVELCRNQWRGYSSSMKCDDLVHLSTFDFGPKFPTALARAELSSPCFNKGWKGRGYEFRLAVQTIPTCVKSGHISEHGMGLEPTA